MYSTSHLANLFNVTRETIRGWSDEFATYLSPTAQPEKNKTRRFSQDDLEILTLVADLKTQGMTYADIHANLKAGQRGEATVQRPEDISEIASADGPQRLALELERTRKQLIDTRMELEAQREIAQSVQATHDDNVRLTAQIDMIKDERNRLEQRVKELTEQATSNYAKGFRDGFREHTTSDHE